MSSLFQRFCGSFHNGSIVNRPMAMLAIIIAIVAAISSGHHRPETPNEAPKTEVGPR
jgi:hypothetical protein